MRQAISPRAFLLNLLIVPLLLWLNVADAMAYSFRISQIGYHPQGSKIALLEDVPADQPLKLVLYDPEKTDRFGLFVGRTVYKISNIREYEPLRPQPGPRVRNVLIDFSDYTIPGEYELRLEGTDFKSPPIKISEYLYWDTLKPVANTFYYQRCGHAIENVKLNFYHMTCHANDALYTGKNALGLDDNNYKDVAGGWHLGSDYAKYTTPTSIAAAKLMAIYEMAPKAYEQLSLDYSVLEPSSGRVPPILYEASIALDWIIAMQRRDGAVHRKVAGKTKPGIIRPEDDEMDRYLYGVSTQDTASAAAALAMAARNYRKTNIGYAVKALLSAERAWVFLSRNPVPSVETSVSDMTGSDEFLEHSKIGTDPDADLPYRLWAAAELYISTGKESYHQYFLKNFREVPMTELSWRNPAIQGYTDYLFYAPKKDPKAAAWIKKNLQSLGGDAYKRISKDPYAAGLKQFKADSNQTLLEQTALLLQLHRLEPNPRYLKAATDSLGYIFGLNPLGISFVTGMGHYPVSRPSDRFMRAIDTTIPGYLVGGPNENPAPDDKKTPPDRGFWSYSDNPNASSSNRSNILYNASLTYVLGALNVAYNIEESAEALPGR